MLVGTQVALQCSTDVKRELVIPAQSAAGLQGWSSSVAVMLKGNLSYLHNQAQGYRPGTGLQGPEGYEGLQGLQGLLCFVLTDPESGCSQAKLMSAAGHARAARRKA